MMKFWMKNHLVSDNNCNIVDPYSPIKLQGKTTKFRFTFSVDDTILQFTISIEQENYQI